ncbi:chorismate mutase [Azorhizobium oxalatiphilum]|uniref:chorismate mutase n=1 Tax=Azorhizobium oxalatiphilum TaxID=980631 RepID=UPI001FCEEDCF|nr:chorismate mutase [Azorhizobium oxalatiphilum]
MSEEHEAAAWRVLKEARVEIDTIDAQIVDLLAARFAVVERVLELKKEAGLPALLQDRVDDVVARVRERAVSSDAPPELVEALWRFLIQWTIEYEEARLG